MTTTKIQKLVGEAIALDREISDKTEILKGMKADLAVLAEEAPAEIREATESGGYSVTYEGPDGSIARVTKPAAKLKAVIDTEKPAGAKLKAKIGNRGTACSSRR